MELVFETWVFSLGQGSSFCECASMTTTVGQNCCHAFGAGAMAICSQGRIHCFHSGHSVTETFILEIKWRIKARLGPLQASERSAQWITWREGSVWSPKTSMTLQFSSDEKTDGRLLETPTHVRQLSPLSFCYCAAAAVENLS